MGPRELVRVLKQPDRPVIVDVRSGFEYGSGHIPGALNIPFWRVLLQRRELPHNKLARIVLTCEHGPRARLAAMQFLWLGYRQVALLDGHMARWKRDRLPVEP